MTTWKQFADAEPDFANRVLALFTTQKHMTMATLRRDGSPRISGTEATFDCGDLQLGMMVGSLKAIDVLRDPRLALHSPTVDPPPGDPSSWRGDAKISGHAIAIIDDQSSDASHRFRIDITEVVLTKIGTPADHLVIESWSSQRGLQVRQRR